VWGSALHPAGEITVLPQAPQLDLRSLFLREGKEKKGMEGKGGD